MKLKVASIADSIDLKKICKEAYTKNFYHHWEEGGLEWHLDAEFSTERLSADLRAKNTSYYFIEHQLQRVGFIKIKTTLDTKVSIENAVELEKIYLLPKYKGMGIGKLALQEIINKVIAQGKKNLFLGVINTNTAAIAFYESLGFKFHSKTKLDIPYFKEALKGMDIMLKTLR